MTTFICSVGSCTHDVWQLLERASKTNVGIRLAELEHSSLKNMQYFCSGKVPIYIYPSFYRDLKLRYPLDIWGLSRDGWVTTELATGSLTHAVSILTFENFTNIVDSELEGKRKMSLNLARLNVKGLMDLNKCAWCLDEHLNLRVNVASVQETHFSCTKDCWVQKEDNFVVLSPFGSRCSTEVFMLVGCSLDAIVNLVFADDEICASILKSTEQKLQRENWW